MKTWLAVITVLILSNSLNAMNLLPDLYTEQAFLARENVVQQTTRLRLFETSQERVRPYLTAGSELMTAGSGSSSLDTGGSYAYAGGGVRLGRGAFQWLNEVRVRGFYKSRPNTRETFDVRSLIVLAHLLEAPLLSGSAFAFLFEPYFELLYTSADLNNVISAGYIRTGVRYRLDKSVAMDLFLEPYATFDRVHHFYNNRADIKPTFRLQLNSGTIGGSLLISYLWNSYFDRGDLDVNPYRLRNEGVRVLAVVGATF